MYSNSLICNILIYLNDNITNKISIEELAKKFFYNRYYIMKLFKKEIGLTITEYINSIRIYNSILHIKNSDSSLVSISMKCGFCSLEYFSETFKQITKVTPSLFKKYFSNSKYISEKESHLVSEAVVRLYEIYIIKDLYLSRRKPNTSPIKKLSIFK